MPIIKIDSDGGEEIQRGYDRSGNGDAPRETWHGPEMGNQPSRQEQEMYWDRYDREHRQIIPTTEISTPFSDKADPVKSRREQVIIGRIEKSVPEAEKPAPAKPPVWN